MQIIIQQKEGNKVATILAVVVFVVMYWVFSTFLQSKKDSGSLLTNYVENAKRIEKKNLNQMMLAPFQSLSHKYLTEEKKEQIQKKLEEAGLDTKPEEYLKMKVAYPIIFTSVFLICTVFHEYYLFKLGVLISPLLYFYPDYLLKRRIKQAIEARKFELPEYLIPMLQLLKTHTTLEAVKKAQIYAGRHLRPYVSTLTAELEMYAGSDQPFRNFAAALNSPEVNTFAIALQQAQKTDKVQSLRIMDAQIKMMRELKHENYNRLIQNKPMEMNKFNVAVIGCIVIYPMVIVIQSLMQGFASL